MMNNRKKELKEQYKHMKPDMGIFIIQSISSNKCYIETTQNLKGRINSTRFQLEAGNHPNKELLKDWYDIGYDKFTIEVLETLEYGDEPKTDYEEELMLLKMIWMDKLTKKGMEFY